MIREDKLEFREIPGEKISCTEIQGECKLHVDKHAKFESKSYPM